MQTLSVMRSIIFKTVIFTIMILLASCSCIDCSSTKRIDHKINEHDSMVQKMIEFYADSYEPLYDLGQDTLTEKNNHKISEYDSIMLKAIEFYADNYEPLHLVGQDQDTLELGIFNHIPDSINNYLIEAARKNDFRALKYAYAVIWRQSKTIAGIVTTPSVQGAITFYPNGFFELFVQAMRTNKGKPVVVHPTEVFYSDIFNWAENNKKIIGDFDYIEKYKKRMREKGTLNTYYHRAEDSVSRRNREDDYIYRDLLRKWELDRFAQRTNINKYIDSVEAVTIALYDAMKSYGSVMTHLMTRTMGDNEEHWMIYLFPTIHNDIKKQKKCYEELTRNYKAGFLFLRHLLPPDCPITTIIMVLISRESGRVLSIAHSSL